MFSNCSDCIISAQHLTRKEQAELILLEQHLHVDYKQKRMVVIFPIVSDSSVKQALKMATALEKRLKRDRLLDAYKYISHHPVLKSWSLLTCIVSNSSLNNNYCGHS